MKKTILLLLYTTSLLANPWGKDADLTLFQSPTQKPQECQTPLFGPFGEAAIALRQKILSAADGPRSHFRPTSSQYTLEAFRKYGFFKGFLLGCDRLMRENNDPWIYKTVIVGKGEQFKWDPVK